MNKYEEIETLDFIKEDKPIKEKCKGRFYKHYFNRYVSERGDIIQTNKMSFQKRLSCKGCVNCGWLDEMISEEVYEGIGFDKEPQENGELYQLSAMGGERDYFGEYDDVEIYFHKINNLDL